MWSILGGPDREWLGDRTDVSVAEVLEHVLGIAPEPHAQRRADPGREDFEGPLGFKKDRPRTAKGRENRYWREPSPVKS